MRFTNTLLLALSAVAVQSAVVPTEQQTTTTAAPQAQATPQLTAEAQCVINNNCNQDVSCIAKCYNVPAPTNDMVYKTNDCATKCPDPTVDSAGYLKCYNDCVDNFYMGNNVNAAGAAAPAGTNNAPANNDAQANNNNNAQANNGKANGNAQANNNGQANNNNNQGGLSQVVGNNANNTTANANQKPNTNNVGNASSSATTMKISALAIGAAALALLF